MTFGFRIVERIPDLQASERAVDLVIQPPAVEHHHARVVQRPDQGERRGSVSKHGSVPCLVEQAPHDDRRVVPIAQDHLRQGAVIALRHLRRIAQHPAAEMLFVHQQADLVAQIELVAGGHAGNEANGVEAHDLDVQQIAPQHVRVGWQLQADRTVVSGVRTAQEQCAVRSDESTRCQNESRGTRTRTVVSSSDAHAGSRHAAVTRYRLGSFNSHNLWCSTTSSASMTDSPGGSCGVRTDTSAVFARRRRCHAELHAAIHGVIQAVVDLQGNPYRVLSSRPAAQKVRDVQAGTTSNSTLSTIPPWLYELPAE